MYFYDEPLTEELEALFLEIDKESKKKASLKPVNSNNDTCGPIFPSFESLSPKYKEEFTKHLIDCYPTITEEQLASVDQELLMEVYKMLPSTSLKRAILIAQEAKRQREQHSSYFSMATGRRSTASVIGFVCARATEFVMCFSDIFLINYCQGKRDE